ELDEITGNDIVATLARIVTGETQLEAPNLQPAFAEANASIRQANTMIGEYEIVDDEDEAAIDDEASAEAVAMPEPARQHVSQQMLAFGASGRQSRGSVGETSDAGEPGGPLVSLKAGLPQPAHPDEKTNGASRPARSPQSPKEEDAD